MNEASVYLLKQNNGTKEIFSNNFFLSTFESYHPLHENDPYSLQVLKVIPGDISEGNFESVTRLLTVLNKPITFLLTLG